MGILVTRSTGRIGTRRAALVDPQADAVEVLRVNLQGTANVIAAVRSAGVWGETTYARIDAARARGAGGPAAVGLGVHHGPASFEDVRVRRLR